MEARSWAAHKAAESETIRRDVEKFVEDGGVIEKLPNGATSETLRSFHDKHAQMARNAALARKQKEPAT